MKFAPIVLFVYKRPSHTLKTLESLSANIDADQSDVIIYSDGPKTEKDFAQVEEVRKIIRRPWGFRSISVVEQTKNLGLAQSVIAGVTEVISKFGRIIVLEDDLVTSPTFIRFMNEGLERYELQKNIFCVSGYSFPILNEKVEKSGVYLFQRTSSWGWGTWLSRWQNVDFEIRDYPVFSSDPKKQKLFNKGGEDLSLLLSKQMNGSIDSWSIRFDYACYKNSAYCLYPSTSKVKNIGTDGSGTHFKVKTDVYEVLLDSEYSWRWPDSLTPSPEIEKICYDYFSAPYKTIKFRTKAFIKKVLNNVSSTGSFQ